MVRQNIFVTGGEFYEEDPQCSDKNGVFRQNSSLQRFISIADLAMFKRVYMQIIVGLRNLCPLEISSCCFEFRIINVVLIHR